METRAHPGACTASLLCLHQDIEMKKRLNYHLYGSVKKAVYKPAAFFRGILLPLAQEGTTLCLCSMLYAPHL
jgi:hypothetical protein